MDMFTVEQAKYIKQLVADSMEEHLETDEVAAKSSKNWFKCQSCKVGLSVSLAPVASLIKNNSSKSEIAELVKFIVALLDLETAAVELIVEGLITAGELSKSSLVKALCKATHAC